MKMITLRKLSSLAFFALAVPALAEVNDMIAYYPLEPVSDGRVIDAVGGYDGGWSGQLTFGEGKVGQAAFLNGGAGTYVPVANFPLIASAITVSAWFSPGPFPPPRPGDWMPMPIVSRSTPTRGTSYALEVQYETVRVSFNDSLSFELPMERIYDNVFYHVAFTYDLSIQSLKVYFGGSLIGQTAYGQPLGNQTIDSGLMLGGSLSGTRFIGALDEVRIYDRALASDEIAALVVPEPTTMALLVCGLLMLCRARATWAT